MVEQQAYYSSSASNEWYTPAYIVEAVARVLGAIDCDPCSNPPPYNVPAAVHYTQADDGLLHPWVGRVFMNPPYGDALPAFMAKLDTERALGRCTAAITLTPARTDTAWFQTLWTADALCFKRGRINFIGSQKGSEGGAVFPPVLAYWGPNVERFATEFSSVGQILYPNAPYRPYAVQPGLFDSEVA